MRVTRTRDGLRVHAVAGTHVVLFGIDLPEASCRGLLGFSIHRVDHAAGTAGYLEGMKAFTETDPGFPAGALYPTNRHPIQSFQWADYAAEPGRRYTYTVAALKGTPTRLVADAQTAIVVTTESPDGGTHDVYFNRGVAASQEYMRRFGNKRPEEVANGQAFVWLSRGLYEAMTAFIGSAEAGRHALRIAAYEFHYEPFLRVVKEAVDRGVDVRIIYDARKAEPRDRNRAAIARTGLTSVCAERRSNPSAIAHNKFIVKLDRGRPDAVWTGGTNFSDGGIFGHSNVAHVVEEPAAAATYLAYWNLLESDPALKDLRPAVEALTPLPPMPPRVGTSAIFSPRSGSDALAWYASLAARAREGILMTFAFGMHDVFKNVYRTAGAPFRMALLESATRPMSRDDPRRAAEEQAIQRLRNRPENTFAIGTLIATNAIDGWVREHLSGLNSNVRYVHDKFMLVDPLSARPVVVTGSANFSEASTERNDENMLVVVGNTRVADVYLGEFMRLYSHHAFRESLRWRKPDEPPKPLSTGDWWQDSFGPTVRATRRRFFARRPAVE